MSGKIEMSRELAERIIPHIYRGVAGAEEVIEELRALLAAPVVERQEPIYQVQYLGDGGGGWSDVEKASYDAKVPHTKHWMTRIVYTSPPAPVAVVLPERMPHPEQGYDYTADGWNACLDKVKELNQ